VDESKQGGVGDDAKVGEALAADDGPAPVPQAADEALADIERADDADEASSAPPPAPPKPAALSARTHLVLGFVLPSILLVVNLIQVKAFTVDDAYISYRYARNLADGHGLVYNLGERIEGYTNFLWTLLLAAGMAVGADPDAVAKLVGGASAIASLYLTYRITQRLRPFDLLPCVATWLLASTIVFAGYAVFGLETPLFVMLLLLGTHLFLREEPALSAAPGEATKEPSGLPWSGLVFGLATLTRPEGPAFIGLLSLFLGLRLFGKRSFVRAGLCAAPVVAQIAFRRAYYGTWLPNTLGAKTGDLDYQLAAGKTYVDGYFTHAGPVLYLGLFALAIGLVERRRALLAMAAVAAFVPAYIALVGGDWMPYFRFFAPFEPFAFLLVDVSARNIVDRRNRAAQLALATFGLLVAWNRSGNLAAAQKVLLEKDKVFWDKAAGGVAKWLNDYGHPGAVALGDIGFVGYATNYPILDMLGLVDPVVAKIPGGYTRKLGPALNDRFFEVSPRFFIVISASGDCRHPSVPNSQAIYRDARFLPAYGQVGRVPLDSGYGWCIYERKDLIPAAPKAAD
jgi:arabinofuranosyltransferase